MTDKIFVDTNILIYAHDSASGATLPLISTPMQQLLHPHVRVCQLQKTAVVRAREMNGIDNTIHLTAECIWRSIFPVMREILNRPVFTTFSFSKSPISMVKDPLALVN